MSFGPTTDAMRRGWQRRNALALVDLLAAAHRADLPPIDWRVTTGDLVGTCYGTGSESEVEKRRTFEAWAAFLAADGEVSRWPDTDHGTRIHLHVTRIRYAGVVDVAVIADVYKDSGAAE